MLDRRKFVLFAAGLLCSAALHAAGPANRLVLQVSDEGEKKWNAVLNNVRNIQAEVGKDKIEIEVVAYGAGLDMVTADSLVANRVEEAMAAGVRFVACGNTMARRKLGKDDLVAGVEVAQAGIVRLMQRQQQGWAYVRP